LIQRYNIFFKLPNLFATFSKNNNYFYLLCGVDLDEPLLDLRGGVDGRCGFGAGLLGLLGFP
jgi:hypothetical protein